jgi:hypothetical protein
MIGRKHSKSVDERAEPKAFDDFELRLGDVMRGERATMGKSLLDVQRELRIKATYIAAIEDCNPDAFDTPGFIAGSVRSYARYLGMNPDEAFETFCEESGFSVAHGMSAEASVIKKSQKSGAARPPADLDMFSRKGTPFVPEGDGFLSRIEPGAIGSVLVLVALIGGIGFGGRLHGASGNPAGAGRPGRADAHRSVRSRSARRGTDCGARGRRARC